MPWRAFGALCLHPVEVAATDSSNRLFLSLGINKGKQSESNRIHYRGSAGESGVETIVWKLVIL